MSNIEYQKFLVAASFAAMAEEACVSRTWIPSIGSVARSDIPDRADKHFSWYNVHGAIHGRIFIHVQEIR